MPADKTLVTDAKKLLRLTHSYFRAHGASATARKAVSFLSTRAGHDRPEAEALLSAESVLRRSCPELTPLGVFTIPRTRPRLNLLLDDLSVRRLYGGNGTAVLLGLLFELHPLEAHQLARLESGPVGAAAQALDHAAHAFLALSPRPARRSR